MLHLVGRIAREFQVRQPDALVEHLVGSQGGWSFKARRGSGTDEIVLVHTVSADSQAAYQHAILIQRQRARKEDDAVLIRIRRLRTLRTRIERVELVEAEERARRGVVDARRIERLRSEADGAI